jgi:hypothetical protein
MSALLVGPGLIEEGDRRRVDVVNASARAVPACRPRHSVELTVVLVIPLAAIVVPIVSIAALSVTIVSVIAIVPIFAAAPIVAAASSILTALLLARSGVGASVLLSRGPLGRGRRGWFLASAASDPQCGKEHYERETSQKGALQRDSFLAGLRGAANRIPLSSSAANNGRSATPTRCHAPMPVF